MGRTIFDWFMLVVCAAIVVLALSRPIDPVRRTLMIGGSVIIGARRAASLLNKGGS